MTEEIEVGDYVRAHEFGLKPSTGYVKDIEEDWLTLDTGRVVNVVDCDLIAKQFRLDV